MKNAILFTIATLMFVCSCSETVTAPHMGTDTGNTVDSDTIGNTNGQAERVQSMASIKIKAPKRISTVCWIKDNEKVLTLLGKDMEEMLSVFDGQQLFSTYVNINGACVRETTTVKDGAVWQIQ